MAIPFAALNLLASGIISLQLSALIEADKPTPYDENPYTPPYSGGGVAGVNYLIGFAVEAFGIESFQYRSTGYSVSSNGISHVNTANDGHPNLLRIQGKIESISFSDNRYAYVNGILVYQVPAPYFNDALNLRLNVLKREDGEPDDDLTNPNPSPVSIPDSGIGQPPPNNITGDDYNSTSIYSPTIKEGGAIAAAASAFQIALATAAIAAAAIGTATTIAGVAASTAAAIGKILDAQQKERELEDEKKKEEEKEEDKKKNREIFLQRLGSTRGDGFLSLVPRNNDNTVELISVEVHFPDIPASIGKYFGRDSPNRYPYDMGLGYIAFYGLGGGVIEHHKLEFRRNNIAVPRMALGLIYHFGLTNQLVANISLYYYREVQS